MPALASRVTIESRRVPVVMLRAETGSFGLSDIDGRFHELDSPMMMATFLGLVLK